MSELDRRMRLIKQVEREHDHAALAVDLLREQLQNASAFAQKHQVLTSSVNDLERNLENTYIVRMFAEFEAALRSYWRAPRGLGRGSSPPMQILIDRVAAYRGYVPRDDVHRAHEVRQFRNQLVHEQASAPVSLSVVVCPSRLCQFLAHLPADW